MPAASLPHNEPERLAALQSYEVLDASCETSFDHIATIASMVLQCPIALVSLVDSTRQFFKGRVGIEATATPRDVSFCAYALLHPNDLLVIPDARLDPRFSDNPMIEEVGVRFYAGAALVDAQGIALGTLCVIDRVPRALTDEQGIVLRYLAETVVTTLELRRAMNLARAAALTDTLTGIANRPALIDALQRAIALQKREGTPFSLILLDLDGFKQVNDQHGHATGDRVLRQVARTLSGNARAGDIAARFGGDEFALLLAGQDIDATAAATRICQRLKTVMMCNGWPVTASLGVASFHTSPNDVEEALILADQLMYEAKASGKNCIANREFNSGNIAVWSSGIEVRSAAGDLRNTIQDVYGLSNLSIGAQ